MHKDYTIELGLASEVTKGQDGFVIETNGLAGPLCPEPSVAGINRESCVADS